MGKYILAIDQGTTGTTVGLVDKSGRLVAKVNKEFKQRYPKAGWVEHKPEDIWKSLNLGLKELLSGKYKASEIKAIGITNQRETSVIWNKKTGKPIHNAIVWQCRRTASFCNSLKKKNKEPVIKKKTGLVVDAYFSASKFRWILKSKPQFMTEAKKGNLLAGNIDTYLIWRLTGKLVHATDPSNASRTQLYNINTNEWDNELLKIFSVPKNILPEVKASSGLFGVTKAQSLLPDGIPITGVAGDQQAALFGQTCFKKGEAKCTFGTGSFILMNSGQKPPVSKSGLLTTIAWQLDGQKPVYALEGGAFICGAAVQWLRDELQIIKSSPEVESLAKKVKDAGGVEFVPALVGLGAPYWSQEARGLITGLTRGSNRSHIARATLDAMALQNVDILKAMEKDLKTKMKSLKVDGGAAANNLLMQIQSDYLGAELVRPKFVETTVLGAAFLAGLGAGFWSSEDEIAKVWKQNKSFKAKLTAKARAGRLKVWHAAVNRAL